MAEYVSFSGFVQFDPQERTAGAKKVRDVVIRPDGKSKEFMVKCTIWDNYEGTVINRGDYLHADGQYQQRPVNGKIYHNLSVSKLCVVPGAPEARGEVRKPQPENDLDF